MKTHIARGMTKKKLLPNLPEGLRQVRQIQIDVKKRIAEGRATKFGWPSWGELSRDPIPVPVIRWIE